ncbi:hypothetical protein JCM10207_005293 [Rhodosporidiobolus poonsookiae]
MLSFAPQHLVHSSPSISQSVPALPASSVALFGHLPHSSILHLALNHLRFQDAQPDLTPALSEKARGKQRAKDDEADEDDEFAFPRRKTDSTGRVLVLTPDAGVFRDELIKEGDVSLFGARRDAETARLLDLVDIRELPTSSHFTYFCNTCYPASSPFAGEAYAAYLAEVGPNAPLDPSYLPHEPTMVILHALSDYLEEEQYKQGGLESYASLLALFLSTFSSLSEHTRPLLILHDALASRYTLPILPAHLTSTSKKRPRAGDAGGGQEEEDEEGEDDRNRLSLRRIAERFFDWVGEAHEVFIDDHTHNAATTRHFVLSLNVARRFHATLTPAERKAEVGWTVSEVGEDDPDGEEGGVRIELVA